jgi:hypothetical protein
MLAKMKKREMVHRKREYSELDLMATKKHKIMISNMLKKIVMMMLKNMRMKKKVLKLIKRKMKKG